MDLNKPKVEEAKPTRKEILSFNPDRLATSETKEGAKAKEAAAVEKIDPNKLIEPRQGPRQNTETRMERSIALARSFFPMSSTTWTATITVLTQKAGLFMPEANSSLVVKRANP